MDKEQFVEKAKSYGYSEDEIKELLALHDDLGAAYDSIPLIDKIVD